MKLLNQEQYVYLKKHAKGRSTSDLTALMNKKFGLELRVSQIKTFKKNHKIKSGLTGRFEKGHIPANKGKKGVGGWNPTQFKKGRKPKNYLPVGSERINSDDYVDIKISDPNKWKGKHILLWEKVNGPVPKGQIIIFADKNKRNFDIDNLLLMTRRQQLIMNRQSLIYENSELTKTGLAIARVQEAVTNRQENVIPRDKNK